MIDFLNRQIEAILDTLDQHYMKLHIRYLYWKSDRQDKEIEKLLAECDAYELQEKKEQWGSP